MKKKSRRFIAVDILLIIMMILPLLVSITVKILTTPKSEGINVTGARILTPVFDALPPPFDLYITEANLNTWMVMISITALCLFLTHGLKTKAETKRQHAAEWIVEKCEKLVQDGMGDYFAGFAPFVATILALSAFSSLQSLLGLYPPTSDLNIVGGWAILVFILITYYKCKCGPLNYLKSFTEPVALLTPMNMISEIATPISMAFRHYGNVLSGTVIATLVAAGLQGLSAMVFGALPGVLGEIPFLQFGIPAILSIYFDIFSGCLQAYIFAMLSMMYISSGFPLEEYEKRKQKKKEKQNQKIKQKAVKQKISEVN